MTMLQAPIATDLTAVLARRDPVAKLAAAFVPALALLVSVDPVAAGILLVVTVASVPAWGLRWADVARRTWPLGLAVVVLTLGNAVFAEARGGAVLVDVGPLLITSQGLVAGAVAGLRVAAIALPGVLAVLTIDPVDLADSLVQHLRVSPRFAYGFLAALRLAPLLAAEWQTLGRARRARGFDAGRNPLAAVRLFAGKLFALLVGAVRRATHLAVAMDARGFDSAGRRTSARVRRLDGGDRLLVAAAVLVTATAITASVLSGSWNPVLS